MLRLLNIVAILALVGSAVYAYSIKYQTSYRAEQIAKTKIEIKAERDAIAVLRADWSYMTRPERLQPLADKYLADLKPLGVTQIVAANRLPEKAARTDAIGSKLDSLLTGAATPPAAPHAPTTTPRTASAAPKTATPKNVTASKAQNAGQSASHERHKP